MPLAGASSIGQACEVELPGRRGTPLVRVGCLAELTISGDQTGRADSLESAEAINLGNQSIWATTVRAAPAGGPQLTTGRQLSAADSDVRTFLQERVSDAAPRRAFDGGCGYLAVTASAVRRLVWCCDFRNDRVMDERVPGDAAGLTWRAVAALSDDELTRQIEALQPRRRHFLASADNLSARCAPQQSVTSYSAERPAP